MPVGIAEPEVAQSPRLIRRWARDIETCSLKLREQTVEIATDVDPEVAAIGTRTTTTEWHEPEANCRRARPVTTRDPCVKRWLAGDEIDLVAECSVVRDRRGHVRDLQHGLHAMELVLVEIGWQHVGDRTTASLRPRPLLRVLRTRRTSDC